MKMDSFWRASLRIYTEHGALDVTMYNPFSDLISLLRIKLLTAFH